MSPPDRDDRLQTLVDLIVQLASGDLTARMAPSPARDNVDAVITGFNLLADELQDIHADLERRVQERTRQLEVLTVELERLALSDPLTGLANRAQLTTKVQLALADQRPGSNGPSMLMLDLDQFKTINDSLGHQAGDTVLIEAARRLQQLAEPGSTVARLGGDEFALLLPGASPDHAVHLATRAVQALAAPYVIEGRTVTCGASAGLRLGDAHCTGEVLLRDADTAMYAAKADGRANVKVYHPSMHDTVQQRLTIASGLAEAIGRNQLFLTYECITNLVDGSIVGAETFVHWQHPDRGVIGPADFIPIAESTGLIVDLGRWVIHHAVTQLSRWQRQKPTQVPFGLHINLSPLELGRPDLPDFILDTLGACGVAAPGLTLELSETALLTPTATTQQTLQVLRGAGVRIAIDDFGRGPSSITALRRLPVDIVKVDRSIFNDIGIDIASGAPDTFLPAVLNLINSAGLPAVVEGVHTWDQVRALRDLNCLYAQGPVFGPPTQSHAGVHPWATDPSSAGNATLDP